MFNVYLSKVEDDVLSLSSKAQAAVDVSENVFETEVLENNTRYFWTVIPRDITGKVGICTDGVWNFKINPTVIEYDFPVITEDYPKNGTTISSTILTFKWSMKYKQYTSGTFDLYLGTSEDDLSLEKAGMKKDSFTIERKLENHQTYYWQVMEYPLDPWHRAQGAGKTCCFYSYTLRHVP